MKYSLTHTLLTQLAGNDKFKGEIGISNYNDLQGMYEAMDLFQQLELMVYAINNCEALDAIIDPITTEGTEATTLEIYTKAKFERSAWDTPATSYKPKLQQITVPFTDYGVGVDISLKMYMKNKNFVIDQIIGAILPAYQSLHRKLALQAMMTLRNPATDLADNPGFWRNITNPGQAITPHPNGMLTFASTESHYMFGALDEKVTNRLSKKMRDKGYGNGGIVIVANESTWDAYKDLFDISELERMVIMDALSMDGTFTIDMNKRNLIQMSDADFPMGYFLAYDPTVKGLYRKVAENPGMRGLQKTFSSMEAIEVTRRAEFNVFELGYGVIERGFGAVMYVGAYDSATGTFPTAPTSYVSPVLNF